MISIDIVVALLMNALTFFFINLQRKQPQKPPPRKRCAPAEQERIILKSRQLHVFCNAFPSTAFEMAACPWMRLRRACPTEQNLTARKSIPLTYNGQLYSLDLSGMSYTTNLNSILTEAYRLGKTGDYAGMKAEKSDVEINGRAYTLTVSYDMSSLLSGIAQIAAQIDHRLRRTRAFPPWTRRTAR